MAFNNRIKKIRTDAKLTQREFAERLGVNRLLISQWETGVTPPGKMRLYQIADEFGVNLKWLTNGEGEQYKVAEVDVVSKTEIELRFVKKLFTALTPELQCQILAALREMIETGSAVPTVTNNSINVNGTVNGDVTLNNEEKQ